MSVPTALYRLFGEDGALLYVGIAKTFGRRWHQHSQSQPWWNEVRRQTIDWHPSREAAESAEKAAIKAERPRYNVTHNKPAVAPVTAKVARRLAPVPVVRPRHPARRPLQPPRRLEPLELPGVSLTAMQRARLPVTLDLADAAAVIGMDLPKARQLAEAGEFPCQVFILGRDRIVPTQMLLATPGLRFNGARLHGLLIPKKAA